MMGRTALFVAVVLASGCSLLTSFDSARDGGSGSGGSGGGPGSGGSGGADAAVDAAVDAMPDAAPQFCFQNNQCTDDNLCTLDLCQNRMCVHPPRSCNDMVGCTADTCDSTIGCIHTPKNEACDDHI